MDDIVPHNGGVLNLLRKLPSAIALTAANSLAIVGLLAWGWAAWDVVLLVWCELVLVALFALARMAWVEPGNRRLWRTKLFFVPVAAALFGAVLLGIGAVMTMGFGGLQPALPAAALFGAVLLGIGAVMTMGFGGLQPALPAAARESPFLAAWYLIFAHRLWLPLSGLAVAHAFSFYSHYIGERQFRRASFFGVGGQFFGRCAITVIALWTALYLVGPLEQEPLAALVGFMIAKTLLDLRALALEDRPVRPATWRESLLG